MQYNKTILLYSVGQEDSESSLEEKQTSSVMVRIDPYIPETKSFDYSASVYAMIDISDYVHLNEGTKMELSGGIPFKDGVGCITPIQQMEKINSMFNEIFSDTQNGIFSYLTSGYLNIIIIVLCLISIAYGISSEIRKKK